MKTKPCFALLLLSLAAACGGSSSFEGSGKSQTKPEVALEDLPEAVAKAYCDAFEQCAGLYYGVAFSLEDCDTFVARNFRDNDFEGLESAVADGRVDYDPKLAPACLDAIASRDCDQTNVRPIAECTAALGGTVERGGACQIDAECQDGRICDTADMCPGTCIDRKSAGLACRVNDECQSGLVCSDATHLCAAPAADGAACEGGSYPGCDGGLACVGQDSDTMRAGVCHPFADLPQKELDEPCDPANVELCKPGLSCAVVALAGPAFACRAIPVSGGTCGLGFPEDCPSGEYCPITPAELFAGTYEASCVPLPGAGQPCADRPNHFVTCGAYARCDLHANCIALRNLGESCSDSDECYSQNCVSGGCQPRRTCQ